MLTDPQTVTINAVAKVMPRIKERDGTSTYRLRTTTDEYVLTVKHTDGKITGGDLGESHTAKLQYTVFATSTVPKQVLYATLNLQNGDGMDLTVARNCLLGLEAWGSSATIDKLLTGEN